VECFYPGKSFPAISTTGERCSLNCRHCARKYLEGMIPATNPDDLLEVAEALAERGAKGFLLSGGVDLSGKVRLQDFVDVIKEIKSTTDLLINAHIGLTPKREIEALVRSGVDAFSVDVYGDRETIGEVLGLSARPDDYLQVARDLVSAGASVVAPHVCIGIHAGQLKGEHAAIEALREVEPDVLVLISLIPTKGSAYAEVPAPSRTDILEVVRIARSDLPDAKLLMGCMRSKKDRSLEIEAVSAGLDGIVLPSDTTVQQLRSEGYVVKKRAVCCALP